MALTTFSMGRLATAEPMNSTAPTGGVSRPMPQFSTIMMPNWMGLMPMDWATGSRIGVAISMIGAMSMIMPSISRIRFSSNAMTTGLLDTLVISAAALAGTCSLVRQ